MNSKRPSPDYDRFAGLNEHQRAAIIAKAAKRMRTGEDGDPLTVAERTRLWTIAAEQLGHEARGPDATEADKARADAANKAAVEAKADKDASAAEDARAAVELGFARMGGYSKRRSTRKKMKKKPSKKYRSRRRKYTKRR